MQKIPNSGRAGRFVGTGDPRKLFLVDSGGALLSALLLGVVLTRLQEYFGMPVQVLYVLAAIALAFCLYSLICYFRLRTGWRPFLKAIAIANTSYCVLTLGLAIHYQSQLTWLGWAYFIGEVVLVMGLVYVEWRTAASA